MRVENPHLVKRLFLKIDLADITALGATTTGQITIGDLPLKARIIRNYVLNLGSAAATLATLTASIGHTTFVEQLAAGTVFAADAAVETLAVEPVPSYTAATTLKIEFVGDANLDTCTGLANGIEIIVDYVE